MSADPENAGKPERRSHARLREVLDDLIEHVRALANNADGMSREELEYARQRLDWLADEVWRTLLPESDDLGNLGD